MDRYGGVAAALEGGFPVVLNNLWLGAEEAAAVATALEPKLMKTKAAVEQVRDRDNTPALRGSDILAMCALLAWGCTPALRGRAAGFPLSLPDAFAGV